MNCEKFEEMIALNAEGDLAARDAARLEAHLQSCSACREFADELQASQLALKKYRQQDFGEAIYTDLRRAVMAQIGKEPEPSLWQRLFFFPNWRLAAVSALLAALAITALIVFMK